MNQRRAVRLAIVGCGRVAEQCHIPAALASSNVELVAIVDSDQKRFELVRGAFGLSCNALTSATSLIGRVDAVVACLPNHLHFPVASESWTPAFTCCAKSRSRIRRKRGWRSARWRTRAIWSSRSATSSALSGTSS